jgi:transposase-like protein
MNCKHTEERKKLILKAIRSGVPYQAAANEAGIDRRTLYNWRKSYPDFAESLENATLVSPSGMGETPRL